MIDELYRLILVKKMKLILSLVHLMQVNIPAFYEVCWFKRSSVLYRYQGSLASMMPIYEHNPSFNSLYMLYMADYLCELVSEDQNCEVRFVGVHMVRDPIGERIGERKDVLDANL